MRKRLLELWASDGRNPDAPHPAPSWITDAARLLLAAALALLPLGSPACTQPPNQPPPVQVEIQPGNTAVLTVLNYTSFGAGPGQFCACALKQVGPILSVNSMQVLNASNGVPLAGFNFTPNFAATFFFNTNQGGVWNGFSSGASQPIPTGVPLRLVFNVTLQPGTTFEQLAGALSTQGRIASDEALPIGQPTGGHLAVLPFGSVTPASVTLLLQPGFTAVANNFFYPVDNTVGRVLSNVLPNTLLYKFNATVQQYEPPNIFIPPGGWLDPSQTLLPGEGAWILIQTPQTLRFSGTVAPPPLRPRPPPGFYLVGGSTPTPADFDVLMGFPPIIGDRVFKYDATVPALPGPAQAPSSVHTFGPGGWDVTPVVQPGKAVFVQLAPPVVPPPVITMHPQAVTALQGSAATFFVAATGAQPLTYQWRRNGVNLSGQTNDILTVPNAQPADEGSYDVVVSNPGGPVTSLPALLKVNRTNTTPTLASIHDLVIHAGVAAQFIAMATDPDIPPNQFAYSLDPGAPPTASIHPQTGAFTWTPTDDAADQIHEVTVRVTDNGVPPMSATQLVSIVVMSRPELTIAYITNGISLTWSSIPGTIYRILRAPRITGPWTNFTPDILATNVTITREDYFVPSIREFYYRLTTTTTTPPNTNPYAYCAMLKRIVRGHGMTADSIAPPAGEVISMTKEKVPFIVKGGDRDQLIQTCVCVSMGRICASSRILDIMDGVSYAWTLVGDGVLMGSGPAVLYEPRDLMIGETNMATLMAEIADSRGNDAKPTLTYTIKVVREEECKYKRTITLMKVVPPGAPVAASPNGCPCVPVAPVWLTPPALAAAAPVEMRVCAGERFVLTASGQDEDTLFLTCLSVDCGIAISVPVLIDELSYTWSAMLGTFPDYGGAPESNSRRTSVIYKAPDMPGDDMVTIRVADSGAQAADAAVTNKIKIKVIKVDLQVEGVSEADEECPGKMLCENDDDDDENLLPDNADTAITGTDAQMMKDKEDMAKLTLKKLLPADLPDGKVYVKKLKGAGNVRIFKDSDNSLIHTTAGAASSTTDAQAAGLFTTLKAGDETYVMEGVAPGELFLALEYTDGKLVCRDVVRVVVISVKFVRDGANDQTVDETDPVIDHVNIGHWGADAVFAAGAGVNGYKADGTVRNDAPPDNFINRDPRRFHLRVQDITRNRDRAARETITASISTLNAMKAEDDNFTDFELRETGNDTGIFVSQAHLLMSADLPNNADDDLAAHDGIAGAVADDAAGDRTHRATIDGFVRSQYRSSATATCSNTIPVCLRHTMPAMDERRVLNVHVTVFNEPYQDTGYDDDNNPATPNVGAGNGQFDFTDTNGNLRHDAGEPSEPFLDLSTGSVVYLRGGQPGAGSRGPVVDQAHVGAQLARANLAWAQACLRIVQSGATVFRDAPADAGGTDILADGAFNSPADRNVIVATFAGGAAVDVLEVFFVAPIPTANAFTIGPFDRIAALGEKTFVFIVPNLDISFRTLAHELGHALDNGPDHPNPQHIFYPANTTYRDNAEDSYRRITQATENRARTVRPAGNLGADGNRMLKSP